MMTIFQLLGLLIPTFFLIYIFGISIKMCNNGEGNEPVPVWVIVVSGLSLFIMGFTLGTIVMGGN